MSSIRLKPGREKSLLRRHPWVFSGAIAEVAGKVESGETVDLLDSEGRFLARGAFSPASRIRVRVWSWNPQEVITLQFFRARLEKAIEARRFLALPNLTPRPPSLKGRGSVSPFSPLQGREGGRGDERGLETLRLIHGESDGLPGLIVDRYANTLVMQCLSAGPERWRETLADLLLELTGAESIFERSDAEVRALEGLPPRVGVSRGAEPPEKLQITEDGLHYWVDVRRGHKTGFYLDQRDNRARLRDLAQGCEVLDCFCYTGGFTVSALVGGAASVMAVDSSAEALTLARENVALNALPQERVEWVEGDVFQVLRGLRDRGRTFDLIVLDPPKFAPTAAQVERAARGYKDINLLAFKLLRPGGLLVTFSCSGGISEELFQKIVAGAALDAGVEAQIIERLSQGADHPVALNFPEGAYLKGLVVRVI